jgi:hypothetical protein
MKRQTGTGKYEASRADSVRSRIASCAVAMLAAHARRSKP